MVFRLICYVNYLSKYLMIFLISFQVDVIGVFVDF